MTSLHYWIVFFFLKYVGSLLMDVKRNLCLLDKRISLASYHCIRQPWDFYNGLERQISYPITICKIDIFTFLNSGSIRCYLLILSPNFSLNVYLFWYKKRLMEFPHKLTVLEGFNILLFLIFFFCLWFYHYMEAVRWLIPWPPCSIVYSIK